MPHLLNGPDDLQSSMPDCVDRSPAGGHPLFDENERADGALVANLVGNLVALDLKANYVFMSGHPADVG